MKSASSSRAKLPELLKPLTVSNTAKQSISNSFVRMSSMWLTVDGPRDSNLRRLTVAAIQVCKFPVPSAGRNQVVRKAAGCVLLASQSGLDNCPNLHVGLPTRNPFDDPAFMEVKSPTQMSSCKHLALLASYVE